MSLEQAKERILQLEEAAERLACVRQHLIRNAAEVCDEVRTSVSRSIDCLRSRESVLLEEVQAVHRIKEESLHRQQGCLGQAVSLLRKAVSVVHDNAGSEAHLADTLERLTKLDMSPEETPYIGFRVDNVHMMEQLSTYGRVDHHGLPLPSAFQDPRNPAASLPCQVEEYEDQEHHVFNKTLQGCNTSHSTIKVNIPKLSQRPEDWLLPSPATLAPPKNTITPSLTTIAPPPATRALRPLTLARERTQPTAKNTVSPSCSLNHWLSLIKHSAESEEEHNFEIVDRSKITDPGLMEWLHPASAPASSPPTDLFTHISRDSQVWLSSVRAQLAKVQEAHRPEADMCTHIARERSSWLRSRASSRQGSPARDQHCQKDFFSHITKDKTKWLKYQSVPVTIKHLKAENKQQDQNQHSTNDKWLICRPPNKVCLLTPSPIQSPTNNIWLKSPTVSTPFYNNPVMDNTSWLLQGQPVTPSTPSPDTSDMDTMAGHPTTLAIVEDDQKQTQDVISAWLMKSCSEHIEDACKGLENMSITCADGGHDKNDNNNNGDEGDDDDDSNSKWLMSDSQVCPLQLRDQKYPSSASTGTDSSIAPPYSDWLLIPCRDAAEDGLNVNNSRDSTTESRASDVDSWSVCSAPHSVSTEQHAHDVATAAEYYNKWLM